MIFLSYAREDVVAAGRLYHDLVRLGYEVWYDQESLLPGQTWKLEIRRAIENCNYFLALMSNQSVSKVGYIQRELKEGLEVYSQLPEGTAFLVPVRLEPCQPPSFTRDIQWADLFPDYDRGLSAILRLLEPDLRVAAEKPVTFRTPGRENQKDGSAMVWVPDGRYIVGSGRLSQRLRSECREWARPAHAVLLSAFWITKYPITNEQYAEYLRANPEYPKPMYWDVADFNGPRKPVVGVSWHDAAAYCRWASLSLPTEAQWEAAARGPDARTYPWGEEPPTPRRANYGTNIGRTTDVDEYARSSGPFETVDQAGNVWEWCIDAWNPSAYFEPKKVPQDPVCLASESSGRAIRGGSAVYDAEYLASSVRERFKCTHNSRFIGFRAVS